MGGSLEDKKKKWVPPPGMSKEQAELVRAGKQCGQALRQSPGKFCRKAPAHNANANQFPKRCKLHGATSGPPKGNTNAVGFGIYSNFILPEEEEYAKQIEADSVEYEIKIVKLRLRRAIRAEFEQNKRIANEGREKAMESSEIETVGKIENGELVKGSKKVVKKIVNYARAIHSIVGELKRLMDIQGNLNGGNDGSTPKEKAQEIQEFLDELKGQVKNESSQEAD